MKVSYKAVSAVVIVGILVAVAWGGLAGRAASESTVGYIDSQYILMAYAGPQIEAANRESSRLQELLDSEAAGLEEAERRELFLKYQRQLDEFEAELGIPDRLNAIDAAIRAAADAHGVTVVLDISAVIMGGVDLTGDVLRRLGIGGQ